MGYASRAVGQWDLIDHQILLGITSTLRYPPHHDGETLVLKTLHTTWRSQDGTNQEVSFLLASCEKYFTFCV